MPRDSFSRDEQLTNPFELAHERRELHLRTGDSVFVVCPARLPAPLFREAWRSRDHGSSDPRKVMPRRDLQFMDIWSPPPSLTTNSVPDRFAGFATVVQKASPGWKQANGLVVPDLPDLNLLIEALHLAQVIGQTQPPILTLQRDAIWPPITAEGVKAPAPRFPRAFGGRGALSVARPLNSQALGGIVAALAGFEDFFPRRPCRYRSPMTNISPFCRRQGRSTRCNAAPS
jgi:hypothetical protein